MVHLSSRYMFISDVHSCCVVFFRLAGNVPTLCVRAGFRGTKLSTQHKSPIGKLNLNVSTSPRMTQNVCYGQVFLSFKMNYSIWVVVCFSCNTYKVTKPQYTLVAHRSLNTLHRNPNFQHHC